MDLKCPYCPEVRPTRSRLATHVSAYHHAADSAAARAKAVGEARTVEDVTIAGFSGLTAEPVKQDRDQLDAALTRTGAGLAEAGREMAEMRAALDAVDERMRKLDAQLTSPATVRRATLNQVWRRLLDAGDLTGAGIVMKMINAVVDDQ